MNGSRLRELNRASDVCVLVLVWDLFFTSLWQPTPEELINMTKKTHHIHAVRHWVCVRVFESVLESVNVDVFVA